MNAAAREVLGVKEGATEKEIFDAFIASTTKFPGGITGHRELTATRQSAKDYLTGKSSKFVDYRIEGLPRKAPVIAEVNLLESESNDEEDTPVAKTKSKRKSGRKQTRRRKPKKPIMPSTRPTTAEEWIEARRIAPTKFTVNSNGDLVVPPYNAGEAEMVIPLRAKEPATNEHIRQFFLQRKENLKDAEEKFAEAKRKAQQTYIAYKREEAELTDVLEANGEVAVAQVNLSARVKFPRQYELLKGLVDNDLSFDWYRRNKITDPVGTIITSEFPWEAFWTEAADSIPDVDEDAYEEEEGMSGGAKPKRDLTAQQRAIIANYRKKRMGAH